jgi:hypothetical protein
MFFQVKLEIHYLITAVHLQFYIGSTVQYKIYYTILKTLEGKMEGNLGFWEGNSAKKRTRTRNFLLCQSGSTVADVCSQWFLLSSETTASRVCSGSTEH